MTVKARIKLATAMLMAASLIGCATAPESTKSAARTPAAGGGTGTIYVNRDDVLAGYFVSIDVAVDGAVAGSVANGGCTKIQVAAGSHVVGSVAMFGVVPTYTTAVVNVPANGVVYIKGEQHWTGMQTTTYFKMSQVSQGRRC
jgi:hypothetical protein